VEWIEWKENAEFSVFLRFPHPEKKGYNNSAFVAVDYGIEIDIHKVDPILQSTTGRIYGYSQNPAGMIGIPRIPICQWNRLEIDVLEKNYSIMVNGQKIKSFQHHDPMRGVPSKPGTASFLGLSSTTGNVGFRNITLTINPVNSPTRVRVPAGTQKRSYS
jgi:hypothetical protein